MGRILGIGASLIANMYSTCQLAKLLALKRDIDPELAGLACVFHDIHTILTGSSKNHGMKAEPHVREIVAEYNEKWRLQLPAIAENELERLVNAVKDHSDKIAISEDPLAELVKDVDTLDAYLHGMTTEVSNGRLNRANQVLEELSLNLRL
ncbi:MAG: HD domain-containing protein [Candidatus Hodarchaeota archaeon]